MIFFNLNYYCSIFWDLRNLQEQAFCHQKLFWPFTVRINCSSDLKKFENSRLSASNFKSLSRSLEQFFLTVHQSNFGKKYHFFFSFLFKCNELAQALLLKNLNCPCTCALSFIYKIVQFQVNIKQNLPYYSDQDDELCINLI